MSSLEFLISETNHPVLILSKKGTEWMRLRVKIKPGIHGRRITWADFYVCIHGERTYLSLHEIETLQTPPTSTLGRGKRSWRHVVDQKGVMVWGWLPAQNFDHAYIQTDGSCRRGSVHPEQGARSLCTTWMVIDSSISRLHDLVVCRLTSQVFILRAQESLLLSVSTSWTYMSTCSSRIYAA